MAVRLETELYAPVKAFFEARGYAIKGEVKNCDLVGMKQGQPEPLIVEMKKTFNLALLLQAIERLKLSSIVYVAVERNRSKKGAVSQRWNELAHLCRKLNLGLMTVTHYKTRPPLVEVLCVPNGATVKPAPSNGSRRNRLLQEFNARSGDYNVGGSNRRKLVTAYREKALRIASALAEMGEASPAQLARASAVSNAATIVQQNHYGWFQRIVRGKYALTSCGEAALVEYATVVKEHATTVDWTRADRIADITREISTLPPSQME